MLDLKLQTLLQYKLGGPQAELFIHKLQQQTGWTRAFSIEAIKEYKRFIYMISVSKSHLTPSVIVDEVWHLHLTFSRCYWGTLCKEILGSELHHDPALPSEQSRMQDQYLYTLDLYQTCFQCTAPKKYWPVAIDKDSKPEPSMKRWYIQLLAACSFFTIAISGRAYAADTTREATVAFWAILIFIIVSVGWLIFSELSGNDNDSSGSGGGGGGGFGGCGGGGCGGGS